MSHNYYTSLIGGSYSNLDVHTHSYFNDNPFTLKLDHPQHSFKHIMKLKKRHQPTNFITVIVFFVRLFAIVTDETSFPEY